MHLYKQYSRLTLAKISVVHLVVPKILINRWNSESFLVHSAVVSKRLGPSTSGRKTLQFFFSKLQFSNRETMVLRDYCKCSLKINILCFIVILQVYSTLRYFLLLLQLLFILWKWYISFATKLITYRRKRRRLYII